MSTCGCNRTQRHTRAELTFLLLLLHRLFLFIYFFIFFFARVIYSSHVRKINCSWRCSIQRIISWIKKSKKEEGKKSARQPPFFVIYISVSRSFYDFLCAQRHQDSRRTLTALRCTYIKKKHNRTQFLESGPWGYLIIMSKAGWAPADQQQQQQLTFFF